MAINDIVLNNEDEKLGYWILFEICQRFIQPRSPQRIKSETISFQQKSFNSRN